MKSKNWIRAIVVLALLATPGYELYLYYQAQQQLAASIELRESMEAKVSLARIKYAQLKTTEGLEPR